MAPMKPARSPAALTFPVPGELGAVLREASYVAELVIRRADGADPMPYDLECLPRVMEAVESADATGRAVGVDLRGEIAARMHATAPVRRVGVKPRAKSTTKPKAARTASTR